jgi:hypothetical protein
MIEEIWNRQSWRYSLESLAYFLVVLRAQRYGVCVLDSLLRIKRPGKKWIRLSIIGLYR